MLRKNGSSIPVEITASMAPGSDGKLQIVGISRDISERIRAEEALRISNETNAAILNATQEAIYLIDPDGRVLLSNFMGAKRYGTTLEQIVGKIIYDFVDTDLANQRRVKVKEVVDNKKSLSFENYGSGHYYFSSLYPLFDQTGNVNRIAVYTREITEEKKAELQEKRINEDLRLVNEINDAINKGYSIRQLTLIINERLREIFNATFVEFFMYSDDRQTMFSSNVEFIRSLSAEQKSLLNLDNSGLYIDLSSSTIYRQDHTSPDATIITDKKQILARVKEVLSAAKHKGVSSSEVQKIAAKVIQKNSIHSILFAPLFDKKKTFAIFELYSGNIFSEDDRKRLSILITQLLASILRKQAEEELLLSEKRNKSIVEAIPDLLFRVSREGIFIDFDAKPWHRLYFAPENFLGKNISDVFPPDITQMTFNALERAFSTNDVVNFEYRLKMGEEWNTYECRLVANKDENEAVLIIRDITEQRKMEQALVKNEEKYRVLMESLENVIASVDHDGTILLLNEIAARQLGGTQSNLVGKNMRDLFPSDVAELQIYMVRKAIEQDCTDVWESQSFVLGKRVWFRTSVVPLHDETGKVVSALINSTDINDLKLAQEELRELNRSLEERVKQRTTEVQDLYNNAPTGYHSIDASGLFTMINDTELKWLGYERSEVVGKIRIPDLLTEESRQLFTIAYPKFKVQGFINNLELELIRKDGSILPVLITATAIYDEDGNFYSSRSTLVDNSERKAIEAEIRRINNLSDVAMELTKSGYWYIPLDGSDTYLPSDRVLEIHGFEKKKAGVYSLKNDWEAYVRKANDELANQASESLNRVMNGQSDRYDAIYQMRRHIDGKVVWIHAMGNVVIDRTGNRIGIAGVSQDITQQKKLEAELQEAKEAAEAANRAKSTFLANIGHEIRTPMNAILGFTQVILKDPQLDTKNRGYVETINRSGEHLLSLINEILEMSKIEAGHSTFNPSTFNLPILLQDLRSMMDPRLIAKNLYMNVEIAPDTPDFIITDEIKVKEILINLLNNAIKFTQKGGLTLSCYVEKLDKKSKLGDLLLHLDVQDTGAGIPGEAISRLFKAFEQASTTTKNIEGTGLGLAISLSHAKLLGGDISVTSKVGKGSCFKVTLVVQQGQKVELEKAAPTRTVVGLLDRKEPLKLLIVDDQLENRQVMEELFAQVGIPTRSAESGMQAVDIACSWKPDLIFMDLRMPKMSGYEASLAIKNSPGCKNIPIVAVTASILGMDQKQIEKNGMAGYIRKPYKAEELFSMLETILGPVFKYSEQPLGEAKLNSPQQILTSESLNGIPDELLKKLITATERAQIDEVIELIHQIEPYSIQVAAQLLEMANHYQYDALLKLFEKG